MGYRRLALTAATALVLTIGLPAAITPFQQSSEARGRCDRYVLGVDGSDLGDCSDERHPCRTIQYAIDQAVSEDVICVAKHTLAGPLVYPETLMITKSVTLEGAWEAACVDPSDAVCSFSAIPCDPANVTIDAQRCGRVISIRGTIAPVIDCFTITGGDAHGLGGDPGTPSDNDAGGGIYSRDAAPTIVRSVITNNYGCQSCCPYGRGGGIYLLNAPATAIISGNVIANNVGDNTDHGRGGGVMLRDSDAHVISNTIEGNRAGQTLGEGGGIAIQGGAPTIADNAINFNHAGQSAQGLGGGIHAATSSPATIERNELRYNFALGGSGHAERISAGGGIYYTGTTSASSVAIIRANYLEWNLAAVGGSLSGHGGGMALNSLSTASVVKDNVLERNRGADSCPGRGGGIYVAESELTIEENVFTRNTATWSGPEGEGGALYVDGGAVVIRHNQVISNTGAYFTGFPSTAQGRGGGLALHSSQASVEGNRIEGNHGTNGDGPGLGGGVYVEFGAVQIEDNRVASNLGSLADQGWGGGFYLFVTRAWLDANVIVNNEAAQGNKGQGGGLRIFHGHPFTLTNNIVAQNGASAEAGGISVAFSEGQLAHNTIARNRSGDGVGVLVDADCDVALTNNIIAGHRRGLANSEPASSTVSAAYTLFSGNGADWGPGVTSTDEVPGPAGLRSDYHLNDSSNAIDNALDVAWITRDVDGDPRPVGPVADVGADEFVAGRIYLPLVLRW